MNILLCVLQVLIQVIGPTRVPADHTIRALAPFVVLLSLVFLSACATSSAPPVRVLSGKSTITFYVYGHNGNNADGEIFDWPKVRVLLVTQSGTELLGTTNDLGEVTVSKARLTVGEAVLFCSPPPTDYQCAALLLEKFNLGFDEFNVQLPTPEVLDRFTVNSPSS